MIWTGLVFLALGIVHGGFKHLVIRDAARDVYNGGGVPVLDFVFIVPIWFAIGTPLVVPSMGWQPFHGFGMVLYSCLAMLCYGLMEWEYRAGKPDVERQLAELLKQQAKEPPPDDPD